MKESFKIEKNKVYKIIFQGDERAYFAKLACEKYEFRNPFPELGSIYVFDKYAEARNLLGRFPLFSKNGEKLTDFDGLEVKISLAKEYEFTDLIEPE